MKNKLLIILAGIILFIFLTFGTYFWYLFFLRASNSYGSSVNSPNRNGNIVMNDEGNKVYKTDADNNDEENIEAIVPYTFSVKNSNNTTGDYTLYLEDVPINSVNDGCTSETLLNRSQLKYQLILNDKIIKQDSLSNIKDNILDKRSIDSNETNNYELRIYISKDATEWEGKHYHYKVVMNKD